MMIQRKIFIALLLSIGMVVSTTCYGQVPGYIGKKVHLQGGIKFFPSFGGALVNVSDPNQGSVIKGMNYRLELGMDFMVSRKSSVGFNTHYFNTAAIMNTYTGDYGGVALEGGAIGAVFKTHFGSWIAPLGPYYRLEAGAIIYSMSDPANHFGGILPPTTAGTGYINNAIGRTHIFANRISLDYGAEIGFVFPPYDYYSVSGVANSRLALHYVANVYIKIGGVF